MANAFLMGAGTGFFTARTEQLKEDRTKADAIAEKIKLIQLKSIQKQQERFEEVDTGIKKIKSHLESGDVKQAYITAAQSKFGGNSVKEYEKFFGGEYKVDLQNGDFDPETKEKLKTSLSNMVSTWELDNKDVDFSAASAEALSDKLHNNKRKIDTADNFVKEIFGLKGSRYEIDLTSAFKGTRKMYSEPEFSSEMPLVEDKKTTWKEFNRLYDNGTGGGRNVRLRTNEEGAAQILTGEGWKDTDISQYEQGISRQQASRPYVRSTNIVNRKNNEEYTVVEGIDPTNGSVVWSRPAYTSKPLQYKSMMDDATSKEAASTGIQAAIRSMDEQTKEWFNKNGIERGAKALSTDTPFASQIIQEGNAYYTANQNTMDIKTAFEDTSNFVGLLGKINMYSGEGDSAYMPTLSEISMLPSQGSPDLLTELKLKIKDKKDKDQLSPKEKTSALKLLQYVQDLRNEWQVQNQGQPDAQF